MKKEIKTDKRNTDPTSTLTQTQFLVYRFWCFGTRHKYIAKKFNRSVSWSHKQMNDVFKAIRAKYPIEIGKLKSVRYISVGWRNGIMNHGNCNLVSEKEFQKLRLPKFSASVNKKKR